MFPAVANNTNVDIYTDIFDEFGLEDKQKKFVMRYCQLLYNDKWKNADAKIEAVKFAGYKYKNRTGQLQIASKLIALPEIKAAIAAFQRKSMDSYADDMRMAIIEKLHYVVTEFDPSIFLTPQGNLKFTTLEEVPRRARWMISEIETKLYGQYADRPQTTVKFHDVVDLLKMATKVLAMEKEIHEFRAKARFDNGREKEMPLINVVLEHEIT